MTEAVLAKPTVRLHHGDCLEFLKTIEAGSVDAVVSDPPYGMKWNTHTRRFCGGVTVRKSKRGRTSPGVGSIAGDSTPFDPSPWLDFPRVVLWGSNHYAQRLPVGTTLVWLKRNDAAFGTFLSDAEIAWMKGGHGVYCHRDLSMTSINASKSRAHPAQKPVGLMAWCLDKLRLQPGMTVFDPYAGSGTTGVACVKAGVNFIGCEIDPAYFAIAKRRIDEASNTLF